MSEKSNLYQKRLASLRAQLGKATLVAVSKYSPCEDVEAYYNLGQFDFGENRVEELSQKASYFSERNLSQIRWHFIGTVQRNKVKKLLQIPNLCAIHSIDRPELLDELIKHQELYRGPCLDLYFEMNLGGEREKHGFSELNLLSRLLEFRRQQLPVNMKFKGLMVMAPIRTDHPHQAARKCFLELAECARVLKNHFGQEFELSMGMSGDYELAVECGSNIVRVGSLLFK